MIDFGDFRFSAPPRTGTTWFLSAAQEAGFGEHQKTKVHEPFPPQAGKSIRVTLVREPCAWLQSYYTSIWPGKIGVEFVDLFSEFGKMDQRFTAFCRDYLQFAPGSVGKMFKYYNADVCLKIEDMPWAFIQFLETLGISKKRRESFISMGPRNPSRDIVRWSPSLKQKARSAEKWMIDYYDY